MTGSQTPLFSEKCDPVTCVLKPAESAGLRESQAGSRGVTCVTDFVHTCRSVGETSHHRFRLLFPPSAPTCAPFDRAVARVESAHQGKIGLSRRFLRPPPPFSVLVLPRLERTLAVAFGLAGSSANKTGGTNRLAGKT